MGVTLFSLVFGDVPFLDDNVLTLYHKIKTEAVRFPERPAVSAALKDLIDRMLLKDPAQRVTLAEVKEHPWVTADGEEPLPSEEENCVLVELSDEDLEGVVTSIPKLDTLILIKTMLKKHSFQVRVWQGWRSRRARGQVGRLSRSCPHPLVRRGLGRGLNKRISPGNTAIQSDQWAKQASRRVCWHRSGAVGEAEQWSRGPCEVGSTAGCETRVRGVQPTSPLAGALLYSALLGLCCCCCCC